MLAIAAAAASVRFECPLHCVIYVGEEQSSSSSDEDALQRMLTKTSQE